MRQKAVDHRLMRLARHGEENRIGTGQGRFDGWGNIYGNGLFLGAGTAALWTAGRWAGNANAMGVSTMCRSKYKRSTT